MIPTLLITMREVVEASLIVATILGILTKLHQTNEIKIVWIAAALAFVSNFLLVIAGSLIGVHFQKFLEVPKIEGMISIASACFVTWAVFFLHTQFASKKVKLLSHMRETIAEGGIFAFTFITVFREGVEIALFLSTLYLTTSPLSIISGFFAGVVLGVGVSVLFFRATIKLPVYWAFRATSMLLIIFAAGLLARGVAAFPFHSMQTLPLLVSLLYIFLMHRRVFVHSR